MSLLLRWARYRSVIASLALVMMVPILAFLVNPSIRAADREPAHRQQTPIRHVVEIMLENHTFDNLFGHFPGANGVAPGTVLPSPQSGYAPWSSVAPVQAGANQGSTIDPNHSRAAELMAMDYRPVTGYKMDGYTRYPQDGMASITLFGSSKIPNEWALAQHFALADRNFQPAIAPTLPNVLYALAATSKGWMYDAAPPSNLRFHTIFDQLSRSGLTSRIFVPAIPASNSVLWRLVPSGSPTSGINTDAQFLQDLKQGTLPAFSFVRAGPGYSEHPPGDIQLGDAWIGQLTQAIMHSRYWKSTALFITYDEGGAYWDHVAPPLVTHYGYGTRTPMIVISPWVKPGVISKTTTNISILSLMDRIWGLRPLNRLNAHTNNLLSAFDFHQRPLPPISLPSTSSDTLYVQGVSAAPNVPFTLHLTAESPALTKDTSLSGPVTLQYESPSGVSPVTGPAQVNLVDGQAAFNVSFPKTGYYRVIARGPNGVIGWGTVGVGSTTTVGASPDLP